MEEQVVNNEELETLTEEQMLENLKADVTAYEKALEKAIADKANYQEQFDVDKEIHELTLKPGALKMINPTYAFQTDEKFLVLQEKKQAFRVRQDLAVAEGQLKQFDDQISNIQQALSNAKEKLAKFGGDE